MAIPTPINKDKTYTQCEKCAKHIETDDIVDATYKYKNWLGKPTQKCLWVCEQCNAAILSGKLKL